jgi:hypothetical protein
MAAVVFEDFSGAATPVSDSDNPYQPLIEAANNDPVCFPYNLNEYYKLMANEQGAIFLCL